ncbi:hypothetical protein Trydic_g15648 [Trypoxylus dichotomus]
MHKLVVEDLTSGYWKFKKSSPLADSCIISQFTSLDFVEYLQPMDVTYPEYNGKYFHDSQLPRIIQAENVDADCVYTDGSKCSGDCGYGVYAPKHEYRRMIRIHDEASIFTAEAAAIKHALKYVTRKKLRSSKIMSDSRSVLEFIQNRKHPTKTHPIVLDIFNELNKLQKAENQIPSIYSPVISDIALPAVDLINVMNY